MGYHFFNRKGSGPFERIACAVLNQVAYDAIDTRRIKIKYWIKPQGRPKKKAYKWVINRDCVTARSYIKFDHEDIQWWCDVGGFELPFVLERFRKILKYNDTYGTERFMELLKQLEQKEVTDDDDDC